MSTTKTKIENGNAKTVLNKPIKDGLSVICPIKNRSNIYKVLPTWLAIDEIDEIIIVDWKSDISLRTKLSHIEDARIKICRVTNGDIWRKSLANNLGMLVSSYNRLLFLDNDYYLDRQYLRSHTLAKGTFFAGNHRTARNLNEVSTNGVLLIHRDDILKVNGFLERIPNYYYEDEDLYERLEKNGLKRLNINNDYVYHIPHDNEVTTGNRSITRAGFSFDPKTIDLLQTYVNKRLACKYRNNDQVWKVKYELLGEHGNYLEFSVTIPDAESLYDDREYQQLEFETKKELFSWKIGLSMDRIENEFSREEIERFYSIWFANYESKHIDNDFQYHLFMMAKKENDIRMVYDILNALSENLRNRSIGRVTIYHIESDPEDGIDLIAEFIQTHNLECRNVYDTPSYNDLFADSLKSEFNRFIIAKPAVFFTESLNKLDPVEMENTMIALTSHYRSSDDTLSLPAFKNGVPNYFDVDSWIFSKELNPVYVDNGVKPTIHHANHEMLLGLLFAKRDFRVLNPCRDVVSISAEQRAVDTTAIREFLGAHEYYHYIGVRHGGVKDFDNNIESALYYSDNNLFVEIDVSIDGYSLKQLLIVAGNSDRNIWVLNEINSGEVSAFVNHNNTNINEITNSVFRHYAREYTGDRPFESFLSTNERHDIYCTASVLNRSAILQAPMLSSIVKNGIGTTHPKISVLTPILNGAEFIEGAIQSVLNQDYRNWEHIVVDGGSTDGTLDILNKYDHLKVYELKDGKGQSDQMNYAFFKSSGEIISYLNDDDYYLPGAFSAVIPHFVNGSDFVFGSLVMDHEDGEYYINFPPTSYLKWLKYWCHMAFPYNPCAYFYRREIEQHAGPYNVDNYYNMDLEFLLDAGRICAPLKVSNTLGVFRCIRNTKTITSHETNEIFGKTIYSYVDKHIDALSPIAKSAFVKFREKHLQQKGVEHRQLTSVSRAQELENLPDTLINYRIKINLVHLCGDKSNINDRTSPIVFSIFSNEYYYAKPFVEHYLNLGAERIIIIETSANHAPLVEILKTYESNVICFHSDLPIDLYRNAIKNYLLARFGLNKWVLFAEPDEYLYLFDNERLKLPALIRYLEDNRHTGILSHKIEMLPDKRVGDYGFDELDDIETAYPLFDLGHLSENGGSGGVLGKACRANSRLVECYGGIIHTLFDKEQNLTSIPLFYAEWGVKFIDGRLENISLSNSMFFSKKYSLHRYIYCRQSSDDFRYQNQHTFDIDIEENLDSKITWFLTNIHTPPKLNLAQSLSDIGLLVLPDELISRLKINILEGSDDTVNKNTLLALAELDRLKANNTGSQNNDESKIFDRDKSERFNMNQLDHQIKIKRLSDTEILINGKKYISHEEHWRIICLIKRTSVWRIGLSVVKFAMLFVGWLPQLKKYRDESL